MRCSRCKHAFFLAHPSASRDEAIDSIAAAAAGDDAVGTPSVASDLGAGDEKLAAGAELDEEQWEFSEEIRVAGDDEAEPAPSGTEAEESDFEDAFDERGLALDDAEGDGVGPGRDDFDGESRAGHESGETDPGARSQASEGAATGAKEPVRDESSFGTVDDFSSWMEDEEPGDAGIVGVDSESDLSAALEDDDPAAGRYATRGTSDDLGDPESWDLIGTDSAAGTRANLGKKVGSVGAPAAARAGASSDLLERFDAAPDDLDVSERSTLERALLQVGNAVGWALTLGLVAGSLFVSLHPEWTRWVQTDQVVQAGALRLESTQAGWIETTRAGDLLVVRGRAINVGDETVGLQPARIVLLDREGRRLTGEDTDALGGEPLPESLLREGSVEAVASARDRAVRAHAATSLAPGEVRPFEVVVPAVSADARRILLEIAPSSAVAAVRPLAVPVGASEPVTEQPGAQDDDEGPFEPSP